MQVHRLQRLHVLKQFNSYSCEIPIREYMRSVWWRRFLTKAIERASHPGKFSVQRLRSADNPIPLWNLTALNNVAESIPVDQNSRLWTHIQTLIWQKQNKMSSRSMWPTILNIKNNKAIHLANIRNSWHDVRYES